MNYSIGISIVLVLIRGTCFGNDVPASNFKPKILDEISTSEIRTTLPIEATQNSTTVRNKVFDKIQNLSYNNSLLISNWLNLSAEKSYFLPIGEPFDLSTSHNSTFEDAFFDYKQKLFLFTKIAADSIHLYEQYIPMNKFSCQFSKQLEIDLLLTTDELLLKSQIHIIDKTTSIIAQGSFTLNKEGSRLLYTIPYFEDVDFKQIDLSDYVQYESDFGQVNVSHSLGNQIDIDVVAKKLFHQTEDRILRRIDNSIIFKRLDQVNNAFPVMSTCLSPPVYSKPNYFVINTISVKKFKSHNMELGPIIIRGFDKLASSDIIAFRSSLRQKTLYFSMFLQTERLYGECDLKYFEDGIENATFAVNSEFRRNWNIHDDIRIELGCIYIHRLDASYPRIYEFSTEDILRKYLHDTIITTLKEVFNEQYGKPKMNSNQFATSSNPIVDENASKGYDIEKSNDDDGYTSNLGFPTRKSAECADERNWFMRLFLPKEELNR